MNAHTKTLIQQGLKAARIYAAATNNKIDDIVVNAAVVILTKALHLEEN